MIFRLVEEAETVPLKELEYEIRKGLRDLLRRIPWVKEIENQRSAVLDG